MTTVLIAVDQTEHSRHVAATAAQVFGPDATYLAINVGAVITTADVYAAGGVAGMPYPPVVPINTASSPDDVVEATADARQEAAAVAAEAGVPATALGDVGDVCSAVCRAAVDHRADVIVTGWHQRSWLASMFSPSLADDLIKSTPVPVLVVPERPGDGD